MMIDEGTRERLVVAAREHQIAGKLDRARAAYEDIDDQFPTDIDAVAHELLCSVHICYWKRYDYLQRVLRDAVRYAGATVIGEIALASPYFSALDLHIVAERHSSGVVDRARDPRDEQLLQQGAEPLAAREGPAGRLRVGFLGADFYDQATAYLMVGLIEHHDREEFEFIAYDYGSSPSDRLRARMIAAFDRFYAVTDWSNGNIASLIYEHKIDILIFLRNPTDPRAEVLARRPAPIRLAYLYNPSSFGSALVDFLVADSIIVPPELEGYYGERIVRMPHCYQPNDPRRPMPRPVTRSELGLPLGRIVLANMGSPFKITPQMFDMWCEILRTFPQCVLWLLEPRDGVADNLRREASIRGVDPANLFFASPCPAEDHLSRLACADLMLDTYPYGGHTGSSDALWAGVPILTRIGETFASRVPASLLVAVALDELIAKSEREYLEICRRMIVDEEHRQSIRAYLTSRRSNLPLFDINTYTREFEGMLRYVSKASFR